MHAYIWHIYSYIWHTAEMWLFTSVIVVGVVASMFAIGATVIIQVYMAHVRQSKQI